MVFEVEVQHTEQVDIGDQVSPVNNEIFGQNTLFVHGWDEIDHRHIVLRHVYLNFGPLVSLLILVFNVVSQT